MRTELFLQLTPTNTYFFHENYDALIHSFKPKKDGPYTPGEIGPSITDFLKEYVKADRPLSATDFKQFSQALKKADSHVRELTLLHIMTIGMQIMEKIKPETTLNRNLLIDAIKNGQYQETSFKNAKINCGANYQRLIIIYLILADGFFGNAISKYLNRDFFIKISKNLPTVLNVLNLIGKLKDQSFAKFGLDTTKPFKDNFFDRPVDMLLPWEGVQDINKFYKLGWVEKYCDLKPGLPSDKKKPDITFISTNTLKNEIIYIRHHIGDEQNSTKKRDGVFVSKIARRIARIFSSEYYFNNNDTGSSHLNDYVHPLSVPLHGQNQLYVDLEQKPIVFPGMATIDELQGFGTDLDGNVENTALSNSDFEIAHLVKIDFDFCNLETDFEEFYTPCLEVSGYYKKFFDKDPTYTKELIETRLKLALFTYDLFKIDAMKCYSDKYDYEKYAELAVNRSGIILQRICCEKTLLYIKKYKISLSTIYQSLVDYFIENDIKKLSPDESLKILKGLTQKANDVIDLLSQFDPEFIETKQDIEKKQQQFNEIITNANASNNNEDNLFSPTRIKSRKSFNRQYFFEDKEGDFLYLKFTWENVLTSSEQKRIETVLENLIDKTSFIIHYHFKNYGISLFTKQPNALSIKFYIKADAPLILEDIYKLIDKLLSHSIISHHEQIALQTYFQTHLTKAPETISNFKN